MPVALAFRVCASRLRFAFARCTLAFRVCVLHLLLRLLWRFLRCASAHRAYALRSHAKLALRICFVARVRRMSFVQTRSRTSPSHYMRHAQASRVALAPCAVLLHSTCRRSSSCVWGASFPINIYSAAWQTASRELDLTGWSSFFFCKEKKVSLRGVFDKRGVGSGKVTRN